MKIPGLFALPVLSISVCECLFLPTVFAMDEFQQLYGSEEYVEIATGRAMPISIAPAIASVITRKEILQSGYIHLDQVLNMIPGINVVKTFNGSYFAIRGIRSDTSYNPDVLFLVDGVPQNDFNLGNQRQFIAQIPLLSISRIELIRGPGSALYGADAFAGVINIITRTSSESDNAEYSLSADSFRSLQVNSINKARIGKLENRFSAAVETSDGYEPWITADAQSAWDQTFTTRASMAPDNASTRFKHINVINTSVYRDWELRLRYRQQRTGTGAGIFGALDPNGTIITKQSNIELSYKSLQWIPDIDINWKSNFWQFSYLTKDVMGYPPGAMGNVFPDGFYSDTAYTEQHLRSELNLFATGIDRHIFRLGVGFEVADLNDIVEKRNYDYLPNQKDPYPLDSITSFNATNLYIPFTKRTLFFAYVQDEWTITKSWFMTLGSRIDYYNDVGGTFNPRIALVHDGFPVTTKFLIGRAFRAPTFGELYAISSPNTRSNETLDSSSLWNYEIAFNYEKSSEFKIESNIFYYNSKNIIDFRPQPYRRKIGENVDGVIGYGFETIAKYKPTHMDDLSLGYAFQKNEPKDDNIDPSYAPKHHVQLAYARKLGPLFSTSTRIHYVAGRNYSETDTRPPVADYTIVDTAFTWFQINSENRLIFSINNIFNANAFDPADPALLGHNAIPLEKRHFVVSVIVHQS